MELLHLHLALVHFFSHYTIGTENYRFSNEDKYLKASYLSRLGSGSASRSLYGPCAIWGQHKDVINSNDEFAIEFQNFHSNFKNYQDTILLIDKGY